MSHKSRPFKLPDRAITDRLFTTESMKLKRGSWLLNFDAETYAEENYAATVALQNDTAAGREYNVPQMTEVAASA